MRIKSAHLVRSFASADAGFIKDPLAEAAFMGRSNVGKSSLINGLLRKKNLARTSGTPGKTRLVHYFQVNEAWYFVDLPGYGYARVSRSEQTRWKRLVEGYLKKEKKPAISLLLLDCRHQPTAADKELRDWLDHHLLKYLVVLTKADKLSRSRLNQVVRGVNKEFLSGADIPVIPFSAQTGTGRKEIWKALLGRLV